MKKNVKELDSLKNKLQETEEIKQLMIQEKQQVEHTLSMEIEKLKEKESMYMSLNSANTIYQNKYS